MNAFKSNVTFNKDKIIDLILGWIIGKKWISSSFIKIFIFTKREPFKPTGPCNNFSRTARHLSGAGNQTTTEATRATEAACPVVPNTKQQCIPSKSVIPDFNTKATTTTTVTTSGCLKRSTA